MKLLKRIPVLILALLMLSAAGCADNSAYDVPELLEPAGMDPDNIVAGCGEIYNATICEGLVLPRIHELAFSTNGMLKEMFVSVGSEVKAGDILAKMDAEMYENALTAAKEGLEYNTQVWELSERMAAAKIGIADLELEQLKANGASAAEIGLKEIEIAEIENQLDADRAIWELSRQESESNISALEAQVAGSVLAAPCDGTIVHSAALEGGYVMSGSSLFSLAEDSELYISADYVSADDVKKAHSVRGTVGGREVAVEYQAMDRVEYISRNDSGKDVTSTFIITDAGDVTVESGMSAVVFIVTEYKEDALIVPANAVRQDSSGYFVYLVDADGTQVRQSIKRGIYNDAYVEIIDGIEEGDVVYAGN